MALLWLYLLDPRCRTCWLRWRIRGLAHGVLSYLVISNLVYVIFKFGSLLFVCKYAFVSIFHMDSRTLQCPGEAHNSLLRVPCLSWGLSFDYHVSSLCWATFAGMLLPSRFLYVFQHVTSMCLNGYCCYTVFDVGCMVLRLVNGAQMPSSAVPWTGCVIGKHRRMAHYYKRLVCHFCENGLFLMSCVQYAASFDF